MRITLDPKLKLGLEYDIWYSSQDAMWICVAGRLPFLGETSGRGSNPEDALKECIAAVDSAFEDFNRP